MNQSGLSIELANAAALPKEYSVAYWKKLTAIGQEEMVDTVKHLGQLADEAPLFVSIKPLQEAISQALRKYSAYEEAANALNTEKNIFSSIAQATKAQGSA